MENKVVLLDEYDELASMLLETLQCKEINATAVVFADNPFLPFDFISMYEYYLNKYETAELVEKNLFYVFMDVPEFWEIQAKGINGAVLNNGEHMATIYFREPIERRNVLRVEWMKENGIVYKIDYYNKYGFIYCTALIDDDGTMMSKAYFTSDHQEVININFSNGIVTLFENGHVVHMYASVDEFEKYTFYKIMSEEESIILTSSKQALWAVEFDNSEKTDVSVVLWTEKEVSEFQEKQFHQKLQSPLYMLNTYSTHGCDIDNEKNEYAICVSKKKYPCIKGNTDILIHTFSDSLHGIELLIEGVPEANFHIAANTAVSQKLMDMSKLDNVFVYPAIKKSEIQRLFELCDLYLDINWGREVDNAVIKASLNGMLIVGYSHLIHNRHYMLEEFIFEADDELLLTQKIKCLISDIDELERVVVKQQERIKESIKYLME